MSRAALLATIVAAVLATFALLTMPGGPLSGCATYQIVAVEHTVCAR